MMSLQQNRVKNIFANELNDKAETAVIRIKEAAIHCIIRLQWKIPGRNQAYKRHINQLQPQVTEQGVEFTGTKTQLAISQQLILSTF